MDSNTKIDSQRLGFDTDTRFQVSERCWCGWKSKTVSNFSQDYLKCERCNTHYARRRIKPGAIPSFYSYHGYWQKRQMQKDHPILEERQAIFIEDGRVNKWLTDINKYIPNPGSVIEIGCAEGSLLIALKELGWKTTGIEPDPNTVSEVNKNTDLDVRTGVFPDVENLPKAELIVACDVLEHSYDPVAFLKTAHRQMSSGGILYLQLPLVNENTDVASLNINVFDPEEHAFIFTRSSIVTILNTCGFDVLENDDYWHISHEITIARKRKRSVNKPRYLANLEETFSHDYCAFIDTLNELAEPLGLRTFCNWAKNWEYPQLWFHGLNQLNWGNIHLLDIGSEQSPWPWIMALKGAHVTIVETQPNWINQWEAVRRELKVNIDWVIVDSCQLPIETSTIDVVTSLSVIEHQEDKNMAINETLRVLKPEGYLGISFDICEPGYQMSYPDWGGSPMTLTLFENLIWFHPAFNKQGPPRWNHEDIESFLTWHRLSAAHHNYITGAVLLQKKEDAKKTDSSVIAT